MVVVHLCPQCRLQLRPQARLAQCEIEGQLLFAGAIGMRRITGEQQQAFLAPHLLQLGDQHRARAGLDAGLQCGSRCLQLCAQAGIAAPHLIHPGIQCADALGEVTRAGSQLAQRPGTTGIVGITLQLAQGRLQALLRGLQRLAIAVIEGAGIPCLQAPRIGDLGRQRGRQCGLLLVRGEGFGCALGIMARPAVDDGDRKQAQAADQQAGPEFLCHAEAAEHGQPGRLGETEAEPIAQTGDEQRQAAGDDRHHVLQAEGRTGIGGIALNLRADLTERPWRRQWLPL